MLSPVTMMERGYYPNVSSCRRFKCCRFSHCFDEEDLLYDEGGKGLADRVDGQKSFLRCTLSSFDATEVRFQASKTQTPPNSKGATPPTNKVERLASA
jgi:hypothetical protein